MYNICKGQLSDMLPLKDHMQRAVAENGKGKTPIFTLLDSESYVFEHDKILERWQQSFSSLHWLRYWFLKDQDKIVGHLKFDASGFKHSSHRIMLALGIEEEYRSLGFGKRLLHEGIKWAKDTKFSWVDLSVFSHNLTAIELYKKFNFKIIGETKDGFRFRGKNLSNIKMTLNLNE